MPVWRIKEYGGVNLTKLFAVLALVLVIVTAGCGFAIHYGGEAFKNAITGHIVLGIVSVVIVICLVIMLFVIKQ
jgi:hypothetical protein